MAPVLQTLPAVLPSQVHQGYQHPLLNDIIFLNKINLQNSSLYAEPVTGAQNKISNSGDNIFEISSATNGKRRVTVHIPAAAFQVLNSGGAVVANQTTTLVQVSSVDDSYLSTLPTPLNSILSNVFDITLQGIPHTHIHPTATASPHSALGR